MQLHVAVCNKRYGSWVRVASLINRNGFITWAHQWGVEGGVLLLLLHGPGQTCTPLKEDCAMGLQQYASGLLLW
jgi:hypothetical protein